MNITGKHTEDTVEDQAQWIYRGIRKADFQLSFSLPEHTKVNNAKLEQGLLLVEIYGDPESETEKLPLKASKRRLKTNHNRVNGGPLRRASIACSEQDPVLLVGTDR